MPFPPKANESHTCLFEALRGNGSEISLTLSKKKIAIRGAVSLQSMFHVNCLGRSQVSFVPETSSRRLCDVQSGEEVTPGPGSFLKP